MPTPFDSRRLLAREFASITRGYEVRDTQLHALGEATHGFVILVYGTNDATPSTASRATAKLEFGNAARPPVSRAAINSPDSRIQETRMKNLNKVAALAVFAASVTPAAFAQSSVTAYGIMDLGANRTSNVNGGTLNELRSGNTLSSRIGFRGREDLGGGLSALFNIESTISADTGAAGAVFWNRQSWVAVAQEGLGQITLGLQLPVVSDVVVPYLSASWFGNQAATIDGAAQAVGSAAARFNNLLGGARVNNAVKITSSSFGGLKVAAMTAAGEGAAGRGDSVGLSYSSAAFDAGLALHQTGCVSSVCSKDKITVAGGSFKFGQGARVGLIWTREKNARNVNGNDADTLSLLAIYPVGMWTFMAGYQSLNDKTTLNQDVKQANLGIKYLLSKRTELYTLYSSQSVDHNGRAGMYAQLSSNDKQNQFNIGVRHSF